MSVTIVQNPELYAPTYNPMVYTLTSTNSTQTAFKYVVDIYMAGAVTKAVRLPIAPEPLTGTLYGVVNIAEVVENFVTQNIGDPTGQVATTSNDESITDYIVKFGEQYETAGVLTVYPNLTLDTSRFAWNGSIAYEDFTPFTYVPYYLANQNTYFLSNSPAAVKTMLTNSHWLYYLDSNNANLTDYFNLVTYDSDGVTIGTWNVNNTLTFADTGEYMGKVAAGPYNLGQLPNGQLSFGVQPIFTGAEAYYTIQAVGSSGGGQHSEAKRFDIIDPCNFQRWNVLFLNRLGGFDTFTFNMLSRDTNDIKKTFYKKNPNRLSSAGAYTFTLADREKVTFFTKSTRKRALNSDWISEDDSTWLEEMLSSPVVYLEDASNNLIAVNITNTKWTKKTKLNDKLFNLNIEIELNDNYRQRG